MTRPLYCDERIWIPVADGQRRRGWTVHTAIDEGTLGGPDEEQLLAPLVKPNDLTGESLGWVVG